VVVGLVCRITGFSVFIFAILRENDLRGWGAPSKKSKDPPGSVRERRRAVRTEGASKVTSRRWASLWQAGRRRHVIQPSAPTARRCFDLVRAVASALSRRRLAAAISPRSNRASKIGFRREGHHLTPCCATTNSTRGLFQTSRTTSVKRSASRFFRNLVGTDSVTASSVSDATVAFENQEKNRSSPNRARRRSPASPSGWSVFAAGTDGGGWGEVVWVLGLSIRFGGHDVRIPRTSCPPSADMMSLLADV
jgi:hypothetical protein